MRRGTPQQVNLSRLSCLWAAPLFSLVDLISTLCRRAAPPSSLLRRRRALEGGALPDLPHRTCGSTIERAYVRSFVQGTSASSSVEWICSWDVTRIRSFQGIAIDQASQTLHQLLPL